VLKELTLETEDHLRAQASSDTLPKKLLPWTCPRNILVCSKPARVGFFAPQQKQKNNARALWIPPLVSYERNFFSLLHFLFTDQVKRITGTLRLVINSGMCQSSPEYPHTRAPGWP
jgi:hypothetical protein